MKALSLAVALLGLSFAQDVKPQHLPDGPQLASLLQGEVLMLGSAFPGKTFQKAILTKLKRGEIKVRLVTGQQNMQAFMPIVKAGGSVRTLPSSVTGGLIVTSVALLAPAKNGWMVVRHPESALALRARFEDAWKYAKVVRP